MKYNFGESVHFILSEQYYNCKGQSITQPKIKNGYIFANNGDMYEVYVPDDAFYKFWTDDGLYAGHAFNIK